MRKTLGINQLIEQGPCPERAVKAAVVENFDEIKKARELFWPWREIAKALGFDSEKSIQEMRVTFWRKKKQQKIHEEVTQ